jgi:hypothetical protein
MTAGNPIDLRKASLTSEATALQSLLHGARDLPDTLFD